MSEPKPKCEKCGVEIMPVTADRYGGRCAPCGTGGRGPSILSDHERKPGRHLDWMCIDIVLDQNKKDFADYFFATAVLDKDPRFKSRSMRVGTNMGLLRLHKQSGEIEVLHAMYEDDENRISHRAAAKIKQHWKAGEIPEKTMYACG